MAGIKDYGVLTAMLSWVLRDPAKYDPNRHPEFDEYSKEELRIEVGGLLNSGEHAEWTTRTLQAGDVVTIKILGPGDFDAPQGEPQPHTGGFS